MIRKLNYSIFVLLVTLIFTFLVTTYGKVDVEKATYVPTQNPSIVDDTCVDTFIRTYATQILKVNNYEITSEKREAIRALLSAMGDYNIKKLNNAIYKGSSATIIKEVKQFVSDNFLWEERTLMREYICD